MNEVERSELQLIREKTADLAEEVAGLKVQLVVVIKQLDNIVAKLNNGLSEKVSTSEVRARALEEKVDACQARCKIRIRLWWSAAILVGGGLLLWGVKIIVSHLSEGHVTP